MNTNETIGCDVIMDLVAVYKDGLASDETRTLVRGHLRTCPDCRRMYAGYHSAERARAITPIPAMPEHTDYIRIARHLQKQHRLSTAVMLSVLGMSLAVGALSLSGLYKENN